MVKKKRQGQGRGRGRAAPELSARRVEEMLLATSFPRLHMVLILSLAAVGAFLTSASLVALGSTSMGLRYALAVVGGYLFFLLFVRVWIAYQTRNWSFGRRKREERDGSNDIPDLQLPDLSWPARPTPVFPVAGGHSAAPVRAARSVTPALPKGRQRARSMP